MHYRDGRFAANQARNFSSNMPESTAVQFGVSSVSRRSSRLHLGPRLGGAVGAVLRYVFMVHIWRSRGIAGHFYFVRLFTQIFSRVNRKAEEGLSEIKQLSQFR